MATTGPGKTSYMNKVRGNNEAALHSEVITLKEEAAKKENTLKLKETKIAELEEELAKLTAKVEDKNSELSAKDDKYVVLSDKYKSLEEEKSRMVTIGAEQDATIKGLQSELEVVNVEKIGFSDKYDETYERLRAEQAKVTVLERRLLEQEAEYETKIDEYKAETAAFKAVADDIKHKYEVMKESLDAKIAQQEEKIAQLVEEMKEQEAEAKALLEATKQTLEQERMESLKTLQEQENLTRKELEERLETDLLVLRDALESKPGANRLSMSSLQGIKGDKDAIKRLIATMTQLQQSYKDIDDLQAKLQQLEQALKVYKAQVAAQSQALGQAQGHIVSLQHQLGHDGGVPAQQAQQMQQPPTPMSPVKAANTTTNNNEEVQKLQTENVTLKDKLKQLATLSAKEVERLRREVQSLQDKTCTCGGVIVSNSNVNDDSSRNSSNSCSDKSKQQQAEEQGQPQQQQSNQSVDAQPTPSVQDQQTTKAASSSSNTSNEKAVEESNEDKPTELPSKALTPEPSSTASSEQSSTSSAPSSRSTTPKRTTARQRDASTTPRSSCGHNHGNSSRCSRSSSGVRELSQSRRLMGNVAGYNSANERVSNNNDLQAMHEARSCSCYSNTAPARCAHAVLLSKRARA